ncbi:hypothetical protein B0H10DRAFT_1956980 [Mycena sp. CBHHK59/15]|nr:hypothetical protein B0H10DRAFT_1956980 [Mycena sp. CBHHK59/15]
MTDEGVAMFDLGLLNMFNQFLSWCSIVRDLCAINDKHLPTHYMLEHEASTFKSSDRGHWLGKHPIPTPKTKGKKCQSKSAQDEIDKRFLELEELLRKLGYKYIGWEGKHPLLIHDREGHIITVFISMPEDAKWPQGGPSGRGDRESTSGGFGHRGFHQSSNNGDREHAHESQREALLEHLPISPRYVYHLKAPLKLWNNHWTLPDHSSQMTWIFSPDDKLQGNTPKAPSNCSNSHFIQRRIFSLGPQFDSPHPNGYSGHTDHGLAGRGGDKYIEDLNLTPHAAMCNPGVGSLGLALRIEGKYIHV